VLVIDFDQYDLAIRKTAFPVEFFDGEANALPHRQPGFRRRPAECTKNADAHRRRNLCNRLLRKACQPHCQYKRE